MTRLILTYHVLSHRYSSENSGNNTYSDIKRKIQYIYIYIYISYLLSVVIVVVVIVLRYRIILKKRKSIFLNVLTSFMIFETSA